MGSYEYKVVAAPTRGTRGPGAKGAEGRFALSLEDVMNRMAAEGWEYQRAETLPSEERAGLTNVQTVYRNVLVFRRPRSGDIAAFAPRAIGDDAPAPLLLPAAEGLEPVTGQDHGLASLLRRRAARLVGSPAPVAATQAHMAEAEPEGAPAAAPVPVAMDTDEEPEPAPKSAELAARFAEEDRPRPARNPADFFGSDTLEFHSSGDRRFNQMAPQVGTTSAAE